MNTHEKKALERRFDSLIEQIKVNCIDYAHSYDSAITKYDETMNFIKQNYAPNAPMRSEKIKEAEQEKADSLKTALKDANMIIAPLIEGIKEDLMLDIQKALDIGALDELRRIADSSSLSGREFEILADKYSGRGYWVEKALSRIASDNGIDYAASPLIDDRVRILDALFEQYQAYISGYEGELKTHPHLKAGISDAVLERSKRLFFGEQYGASLDAYANGVITGLRKHLDSPTDLRQILKNALDGEKTTEGRKNAVMCVLAFRNNGAIPDYVIESLGIADEIKDFRETENFRLYQNAEKQVAILNNDAPDSLVDRLSELRENAKDNKFLLPMIEDICKRSPELTYAKYMLDSREKNKEKNEVDGIQERSGDARKDA